MKGRQGTEPDQLYADSYLVVSRSAESSGLTISQPEGRCYSNCNRYVFTITNIITKYICDFHPVPSMYVHGFTIDSVREEAVLCHIL